MKLIHCADLHLDAAFSSHLTREQAAIRRQELLKSMKKMVEFACTVKAQAVLICGDLFDSTYVTKTTLHALDDLITSHPEIDFLYLKGNHDSVDFYQSFDGKMPENIKTFSDSWTSYTYDDVVITGAELTRQTGDDLFEKLSLDPDKMNIVMLHGQVTDAKEKTAMADIPLQALKDKNIDYLALGHIHSYQAYPLDQRGVYCYSGCLMGRGFDECGEKGYVLIDAAKGRLSHAFMPVGGRTIRAVQVDVTDCMSSPQVLHAIEMATSRISEQDMVSIELTGQLPMDAEINMTYIKEELSERFYLLRIKDHTRFTISYEPYRLDRSLKGEFIRLMEKADVTEEEKEQIIRLGLQALAGEEPFV